jgi:hypothetical protein
VRMGSILYVNQGASVAIRSAHEVAAKVDSAYSSRQVTRMEEAIESDPELAIGTAKEFIETMCKTILDGRRGVRKERRLSGVGEKGHQGAPDQPR